MYYFIEPEVAGGWGGQTIADTSVHPPVVHRLQYQFEGWLGDDLLETFPCYIISEALKNDLVHSGLTGFEVDDVQVSTSDEFMSDHEAVELPRLYWTKVKKADAPTDFRISGDNRLMVSELALSVLRRHSISHADIDPVVRM